MGLPNLEMGIIFLIQMQVGILGNSILLLTFNISMLSHNHRPTDQILNQLVLANSLVLFSKGIPQTMAALGWKCFLDDTGCKLVFYLHRVGRGVSLSTTCLLSSFQAIKLRPNFSRWLELRVKSPKCIGFSCSFSWILNLLINIFIPMRVTGPLNRKNISLEKLKDYGCCSGTIAENFTISLYALIYFFTDFICLGLMVWSSSSMVFVLHRHKQRIQHIHSNRLAPKPSHEARAIHTILILVTSYVSFYLLSSILTLCISLIVTPNQWLVDSSVMVASCFPTFSPFVLIRNDKRVSKSLFSCWVGKPNFLSLVSSDLRR